MESLVKQASSKMFSYNLIVHKTKFWEGKDLLKQQGFISKKKPKYKWDKLTHNIQAVGNSNKSSKMN